MGSHTVHTTHTPWAGPPNPPCVVSVSLEVDKGHDGPDQAKARNPQAGRTGPAGAPVCMSGASGQKHQTGGDRCEECGCVGGLDRGWRSPRAASPILNPDHD